MTEKFKYIYHVLESWADDIVSAMIEKEILNATQAEDTPKEIFFEIMAFLCFELDYSICSNEQPEEIRRKLLNFITSKLMAMFPNDTRILDVFNERMHAYADDMPEDFPHCKKFPNVLFNYFFLNINYIKRNEDFFRSKGKTHPLLLTSITEEMKSHLLLLNFHLGVQYYFTYVFQIPNIFNSLSDGDFLQVIAKADRKKEETFEVIKKEGSSEN